MTEPGLDDLKEILQRDDLVPEEWARHPNGAGWVQIATVDIDDSVYVAPNAAVAGHSRLRFASVGDGCRVDDSTVTQAALKDYSQIRNSTVDRSEIDNFQVEDSQVTESYLETGTLLRCTVQDRSQVINTNAKDTLVSESVVEDSMTANARIEKLSTVSGASIVENSRIIHSIVYEETVIGRVRENGKDVTDENPWAGAARGAELDALPGREQADRAVGTGQGAGPRQ